MTAKTRLLNLGRRLGLAMMAWLVWTAVPAAHDIPSDVRIQIFLRPAGNQLRMVARVPLAAMNDIPWPTQGTFLSLADPDMPGSLRDGARTWIAKRVQIYEDDQELPEPRLAAVRVSLPSDRSFDAYDSALQSLGAAPLAASTQIAISQAVVDVLFEYPIRSATSRFSIDPHYQLLGLRSLTVLRFGTADDTERALEFHDDPGLVRLDPRWGQAVRLFIAEGFHHILSGTDHLLFLFCLVIPFRRFRSLLVVVTAFTIAHSITLIASAYGMAPDVNWFPPLVETLIATSIVYMALENIVAPGLGRRWMIAFGFGLVHGFGFSFALRDTLQLAGSHLITSLLSFNIGVELGQIAVLAVLLPALALLFRYVMAERIGTIVLSALVAHTAWHWMIDRAALLWQYQFQWPAFTPAFFAMLTRWLMIAVAVVAAGWVGRGLIKGTAAEGGSEKPLDDVRGKPEVRG